MESFLASLPTEVEEIARALRRRIRSVAPEAVEQAHGGWKVVGYSLDGRMKTTICAIAPHSRHVNLQLFHGVDVPDPEGLLEGTGKRARHVKLRSASDVEQEAVAELIRRSLELAEGAAQD